MMTKNLRHCFPIVFCVMALSGCIPHKKIPLDAAVLNDFSLLSVPAGYRLADIVQNSKTERVVFMEQAYPSKTPGSLFVLQIDRTAPSEADAKSMSLGHIDNSMMTCDRVAVAQPALPPEADEYDCILQTAYFPPLVRVDPQLKLVLFRHAHETDYVTGSVLPQKRSEPAATFSASFDQTTFEALVHATAIHSAALGKDHRR